MIYVLDTNVLSERTKGTPDAGVEDFLRRVPAENVRVALEYVARGEAPYGIVYATDAKVTPNVWVVGVFPESTHAPIIYPAAMIKTASPSAKAFLSFLGSKGAGAIFQKAGFTIR